MQEKNKWYSARFDRIFKDIFCGEDNQSILELFLSRLLKKDVKIEMYLTNELKQVHQDIRRKTVDLLIKVEKEYILLELNNGYSSITNFRNYIFFSSVISQKTKRGEKYDNNVKFLLINLTYGLPPSSNFYFDKYVLISVEGTSEKYIDNIEVLVFNMDKIMESWYNKDMEKVEEFKHLIMLDCTKEDLKILSKGG